MRPIMKWNHILPFALGSVLALSACSDSGSDASRESDVSSSSGEELSSSSSVEPSPSFDASNLYSNMNLGSRFGTNLWLSAGKNGLYSLWFVDEKSSETTYGTVAVKTDLSSGVLSFDTTSGFVYATNDSKGDSVLAWITKGIRLEFSMEDSSLMVKIDDADPVSVEKATRQVYSGVLSRADSLVGKILEWSDGDSSALFRFYKNGEYVRITSESFDAGYYDVHRQHLLTLPVHAVGKVSILSSYVAETGNGSYMLDNQIEKKEYKVSSMTVEYPDASLFTGSGWSAESNDTLKWVLDLQDDETYTLKGKTGMDDSSVKIQREGVWAVFGDYLTLTVDKCMAAKKVSCPAVEYGTVSDLKKSGFEFENSDDSTEYAAPKVWTAIEEE